MIPSLFNDYRDKIMEILKLKNQSKTRVEANPSISPKGKEQNEQNSSKIEKVTFLEGWNRKN
jgi:hypothetical protein